MLLWWPGRRRILGFPHYPPNDLLFETVPAASSACNTFYVIIATLGWPKLDDSNANYFFTNDNIKSIVRIIFDIFSGFKNLQRKHGRPTSDTSGSRTNYYRIIKTRVPFWNHQAWHIKLVCRNIAACDVFFFSVFLTVVMPHHNFPSHHNTPTMNGRRTINEIKLNLMYTDKNMKSVQAGEIFKLSPPKI